MTNYPAKKTDIKDSDTITFTIECSMKKRWVDYFLSMLNQMQHFGYIGHSGTVKFFSDGDGDFRPTFQPSIPYEQKTENSHGVFDAG